MTRSGVQVSLFDRLMIVREHGHAEALGETNLCQSLHEGEQLLRSAQSGSQDLLAVDGLGLEVEKCTVTEEFG